MVESATQDMEAAEKIRDLVLNLQKLLTLKLTQPIIDLHDFGENKRKRFSAS